jgi:hypothetical protein
MDTGNFAEWVLALSAVAASWQGIVSLSQWRHEEGGRRRMKVAETALAEFYEARDIFKWVRSRALRPEESSDRPFRDDESTNVQQQRDIYFPILKRLADDGEFFGRMRARRYRVLALFGPPALVPYDLIEDVHDQIATAAKMLIQTRQEGESTKAEIARDAAWQDTVWDDADRPDAVNATIEKAVEVAEEIFQPEIVGRTRTRQ